MATSGGKWLGDAPESGIKYGFETVLSLRVLWGWKWPGDARESVIKYAFDTVLLFGVPRGGKACRSRGTGDHVKI